MEPGFKESEKQQSLMAKARKGYELSANLIRAKDMLKDAQDKRRNAFDSKSAGAWSDTIYTIEAVIDELEARIRMHHNQQELA